jgi:hypothetical protein
MGVVMEQERTESDHEKITWIFLAVIGLFILVRGRQERPFPGAPVNVQNQ